MYLKKEHGVGGATQIRSRSGAALAVREARFALSDLDDVTVRIADVAACLAVLGDRLRDEIRSSTFP